MPRVSVIITTHNRCRLLSRAIDSVLGQTYRDFELIVIDDGSTDETRAVLARYEASRVLRAQRVEVSRGANYARNRGVQVSTGEYLAFLDDDDEWFRRKLERQIEVFATVRDVALVSCWFSIDGAIQELPQEVSYRALLSENLVGGFSMCLLRKCDMLAVGGLDESLGSSQDWDLWLRLGCLGHIVVVPECLVRYSTVEPDRITKRRDRQVYANYLTVIRRHEEEMGLFTRWRHRCVIRYHTMPESWRATKLLFGGVYWMARALDRAMVRGRSRLQDLIKPVRRRVD